MLENYQNYPQREQTWVKHFVLRKYLAAFGHIIGFSYPSITYVDGFSGPWNIQTDDMSDTSFSIAINELRKAQQYHATRGKKLGLRCVFLEEDRTRYSELKSFANRQTDIEILTHNASFEKAIPEINNFISSEKDTFPFIFIDPTGWTGFSLHDIAPLLRQEPCEVLINFMLEFIRRFIEADFSRESFTRLFGSNDFDVGLRKLQGLDRDDAIAERYCRSLRETCDFKYVQRAIVLHPNKDKTHFLLIYGTRHQKGVQKFKEVEKTAMSVQETSRANVEIKRDQQKSFLNPDDMPESVYYISLRARYIKLAKESVWQIISNSHSTLYDQLWETALTYPLVWENDLREWLEEWRKNGSIRFEGVKPRERTLKCGKGHFIKPCKSQ